MAPCLHARLGSLWLTGPVTLPGLRQRETKNTQSDFFLTNALGIQIRTTANTQSEVGFLDLGEPKFKREILDFGLWAAPGCRDTPQKGGGLQPHTFLRGTPAARGRPEPKIQDLPFEFGLPQIQELKVP